MILAGIVTILLGGCAMFQKPTAPALVGTWTNALGTVWTIKGDGTFDFDLDQDGQRDGAGRWSVTDDQMTLQRTSGIKLKGCDGKGVYHFTRRGDTVQFTLVNDACRLRRKNMLLVWKLK
jgi:hypothetical protein